MIEECGNRGLNGWWTLSNGTAIHETAVVQPWVKFDDICIVLPYAVVGREPSVSSALARQPEFIADFNLKIGIGTVIGCHAIIYNNVEIGNECLIGDHALVREGTRIGNKCVIGCHVSISYNCKIADNCRFQNGGVFHGECGEGCFFGVGVICSSDRRIDLDDYRHLESKPPKFGNRVMVGSGANILPEVEVGDNATIGAGSVVTRHVLKNTTVMGLPAKNIFNEVERVG